MHLQKPPIVQAWIAFAFEHSSECPPWEEEVIEKFIREKVVGYSIKHKSHTYSLLISGDRGLEMKDKPQLKLIKAFSADDKQCFQITENGFAFNLIQSGADYEGFQALKAGALELLDTYSTYFKPIKVVQLTIHHVNLVEIESKDDEIRLDNYLAIIREIPEERFGWINRFEITYNFTNYNTGHKMVYKLKSEPSELRKDPNSANSTFVGKFRMEWSVTHEGSIDPSDKTTLQARLASAHDVAVECFKNSFTEQGWNLFLPDIEDKPLRGTTC